MTSEELERAMQFIVDQQAKTEVTLQQLAEAHAQGEKRTSRLEGAVVAGINLVNGLNKTLSELAEGQKKAQVEMAEQRARLDETNERQDIFINVLERYISEGRNGKLNGLPPSE